MSELEVPSTQLLIPFFIEAKAERFLRGHKEMEYS